MSIFSDKLKKATNEDKQVNPAYVQEIKKVLPKVSNGSTRIETDTIIYPEIKTDGIFRCYYIDNENGIEMPYLLHIECKLDVDFSIPTERANVLLQVCSYLKQIKDSIVGYSGTWESLGTSLPKVIVLGSKINCMALPSNLLISFAMNKIEGFKSASTAYTKAENKWLIEQIANDGSIQAQSIIYDTSDKDCITRLCEEIVKLGKGLKITDDLNEHTVSLAFDFFDMYVLDAKSASKLSSREKVDLFIGTFFNEEFEETTSRGQSSADKLKIHGVEVKVNPDKYNQFKILYNMREYSRLEQKEITAITDRLIEDTDRRRKGDFYTPSIWVDEAHKLLDKNLGENWRDEYMVWDCAWGTGNLTRDYQFNDLYCSTLQQEDLNIATRYNKNAVKFQYDFLNDDVEEMESIKTEFARPLQFKDGINMSAMEPFLNFTKYSMAIDKGYMTHEEGQIAYDKALGLLKSTKLYKCAPTLIDRLLGDDDNEPKKLLFLINPPYAGSGSMTNKSGTNAKESISESLIVELMKDNKFGGTNQLYIQFIYRIICIRQLFGNNVVLGLFSPSSVMNGVKFEGARQGLSKLSMGYADGFMIQASNFADVADNWAISFTLWNGESKQQLLSVMDNSDGKATCIGKHELKMIESKEKALNWIKTKRGETKPVVKMTSAINLAYEDAVIDKDALAIAMMDMNIIESNAVRCAIMQAPTRARWSIIDIKEDNFDRVISYFSARKMIIGQYATWVNSKDEYMIPNISDDRYSQWQNDCIVYSLFGNALNTSSMRNISYKGKTWNIQNEFFWMSVKEIANLAGGLYSKDDINTAIEDDIEAFGKERFVYKKLQTVTLSPDAQAVLDKARELLKSSFKYRKQFNQAHPEYHINTWDAGWYQIKGLLKEYDPDGLKQFNKLYKQLEDRMRPLVYELGFLYK